ncbi:hypothetical protein ColTof4_10837 [Colletotrichum tofieldiae]|nr:hypothetical protein ColTof3_06954 [Colletotrichum tofieldiae]GKT78414.1 hypothetical protein ColTof4_10837 [Colletotrichum tofieldiae]GKT85777.1 hypothetical protein Ct61P_03627 [Colletotrichum tofieldiae]
MAAEEFRPNNTIAHRYAKADVLQKALIDLGFEKKDIIIRANNQDGFKMQLPRVLELKETATILKAFADAKSKAMADETDETDE